MFINAYHWGRERSDENVDNLWETIIIKRNNKNKKDLKYF